MARGHCCAWAIILCLLVILQVHICTAQQTDFTNGVRLYQSGEYQNAVKSLEAAVAADATLEPAWYYLGLSRFNLQPPDYESALAAFQKAADLNPTRPGIRLMVGQIYESQGAFTEAIKVYQDELRSRSGKDVTPVQEALGRTLFNAGRLNDANAQLIKVTNKDPHNVEALYYEGLIQAAQGNHRAALQRYEAASKAMDDWRGLVTRLARLKQLQASGDITPAQQRDIGQVGETLAQEYGPAQEFGAVKRLWPQLNKATGTSLLALGEYASARNAYRKALDKEQLGNPADADAYTLITQAHLAEARHLFVDQGLLFQAIGVVNDAIESAKTAQEKNPNYAPAYSVMGEIYLFQAKTYTTKPELNVISHSCTDAAKQFAEALKRDPNYVDAMKYLAEANLLCGKASEARDQLTKGLTLQSKRSDLHAQMAQVLLALEDPEAALKEAQTALMLDRRNPDALNAAGMVYMYYRDDLGEATDYFGRATAADPRRWDSFANLGLAFFQMESWYRARREFKAALDLIPKPVIANTAEQQAYLYYLIARTYHQTSMFDQEIEALNSALGLYPSHVDTLRQLALAYEGQRKYRAAEQTLQDALNVATTKDQDAEINVQLASMYEKEGRLHEAIAAYSTALNADPNSLAAQAGLDRLKNR